MLTEERKKLKAAAAAHEYMSIGINSDSQPVRGGFIPWEVTAHAFNMKTPLVTIAAADLDVYVLP